MAPYLVTDGEVDETARIVSCGGFIGRKCEEYAKDAFGAIGPIRCGAPATHVWTDGSDVREYLCSHHAATNAAAYGVAVLP